LYLLKELVEIFHLVGGDIIGIIMNIIVVNQRYVLTPAANLSDVKRNADAFLRLFPHRLGSGRLVHVRLLPFQVVVSGRRSEMSAAC
jgi:hypothetical protein